MIAKMNFLVHLRSSHALLLAPLNYANRTALLVISKNSLVSITASMLTVASCRLVMNRQPQFIPLALRYARQLNKL
jgi:hypothetical protein